MSLDRCNPGAGRRNGSNTPPNPPAAPALSGAITALGARIEASTDGRIDRLVGVIEEQGKQIAELTMHVGLLVQAVTQLLGEEAGTPVDGEEEEHQRVDLDGKPY